MHGRIIRVLAGLSELTSTLAGLSELTPTLAGLSELTPTLAGLSNVTYLNRAPDSGPGMPKPLRLKHLQGGAGNISAVDQQSSLAGAKSAILVKLDEYLPAPGVPAYCSLRCFFSFTNRNRLFILHL